MNLLDRLVMGVSPERGLARVQARARAAAVMNYDAATKGRRTYGWTAPASSADTAATVSRAQLRNLARDMIRNRAFAARAQMVVTANVVGTGIMPSVVAEDERTRDRVGEVIRAHLMTPAIDAYGEHALPSLQRIVMNAVFEDGEVLVLRRFRAAPFEAGLPLPFQLQVMEADHLDTSITSYGRNQVIEGVEIGPTGRITAYHLFDHHPGDAASWARRSMTSRRVAASEVLHVRRADRPGQLRGVTWLAPVMMTLGELSDYQEAQILKQRMASLLAAVVTTEEGGASWKGAGLEELAPGAVVGLEPGQDVTFSEPPKLDGYEGFMRQGLAAVAMGIGITLESLSGDLSGVNYSSGRMGRMEMDRLIETWQQQVIIAQFCEGVARWIAEAWPLVGQTSPVRRLTAGIRADAFRLEWTAPRRALIDPTKEIPAMAAEIEAGLTSRQRQQRRLGYDPDVIRHERAEDAAKDAAMPGAAPAGGAGGTRPPAPGDTPADDTDATETPDTSEEETADADRGA